MESRNILIEYDKAGAEWVCVAYLTGDSNMLSVVNSGKSPHPITGSYISGASIELVEREYALVGKTTDPTELERLRKGLSELENGDFLLPRSMSIRQAGKKSNHALNYNMGYRRFALENEMDEAEAKKIVSLYREQAYPGIPVWHDTIQERLRKDRTLINCFGRKRTFRDGWGPELFDAAYAFIPQSTVFDITRIGMVKAWEDSTPEFQLANLLGQVHDSLLYQYPVSEIGKMSAFLHIMSQGYMNPMMKYGGRQFLIETDIKIGFNWSDAGMHKFVLGEEIEDTRERLAVLIEEIWGGLKAA